MPEALKKLVANIALLPGIGEKTASKLAFFLMASDQNYRSEMWESIQNISKKIDTCVACGSYKDTSSKECNYCADDRRDTHVICVVEEYQDLLALESTGVFHGKYHVLGGAISPMKWLSPADLGFASLFARLDDVEEIIIATNPNFEGEATAMYIREHIPQKNIKLSRLSRGLPNAGYIEYADDMTLMNAFQGRQDYI